MDAPRTWVEFTDPAEPVQRLRCDLTWLTSSWRCLFGQGCPGIYTDRPDDGCCTLGAHFTDADDLARVTSVVEQLGPDQWQFRDVARGTGWRQQEGAEVSTAVVDGACVFLNRPGFPAGSGCALHQHALAQGLEPLTTKPDVCWQLPVRRAYRTVELPDDTSYLEITITEYDRRSWGPGGHDLDWYCTGRAEAHTASAPVYLSLEAELIELVGRPAYAEMARLCQAHLGTGSGGGAAGAPRPDGRDLLPLLVHPASLRARQDAAR